MTAWDYAREIADARDHSTYDEPTIDRDEQEWLEADARRRARARGDQA